MKGSLPWSESSDVCNPFWSLSRKHQVIAHDWSLSWLHMAPLPINFIQFQFGGMICLRLARAWGMKSLLRRRCYLSNRYILRLSSGQNALAPYLLLHSSLPAQGFWKRTLLDSMPRRNQDSAGCCKSEHFCSDYEELKPGQLNKIDNKIAKVYQSNIVYYIFILYCIILNI